MTKLSGKPRDEGNGLSTWFASARRAGQEELACQIEFIANNSIVNGVLVSVSGLLAILNEHRQVLAVNDSFFTQFGIVDPAGILGLRPGEALQCVHSGDNIAGCGTGEFCSTCGAAIAITTSLSTNRSVERKCIMTVNRGDFYEELCFTVKASPLNLDGHPFVLLFLHDISEQERRSTLERIFMHDIKNMVMSLGSTIELLSFEKMKYLPQVHDKIRRLSDNLLREVKIQSSMANNSFDDFPLALRSSSVQQVIEEIRNILSNHPSALGRTVTITEPVAPIDFSSDVLLLVRVLTNMLLNALEATAEGGEVKFWVEQGNGGIIFRVWNRSVIPEETARRIFQRFFSTKQETGRGFGTFSMKLFGEKLLGGKVTFFTSENDGTVFSFFLPDKSC